MFSDSSGRRLSGSTIFLVLNDVSVTFKPFGRSPPFFPFFPLPPLIIAFDCADNFNLILFFSFRNSFLCFPLFVILGFQTETNNLKFKLKSADSKEKKYTLMDLCDAKLNKKLHESLFFSKCCRLSESTWPGPTLYTRPNIYHKGYCNVSLLPKGGVIRVAKWRHLAARTRTAFKKTRRLI